MIPLNPTSFCIETRALPSSPTKRSQCSLHSSALSPRRP